MLVLAETRATLHPILTTAAALALVAAGVAVRGQAAIDGAAESLGDAKPPTAFASPQGGRPRPASTPAPPPSARLDLTPAGLRTVVVDAGHGGDDEGASSAAGTKEKDLTLIMARRLKSAIESRLGLRVLMTRDADDTVPFDRRTDLANHNRADAFVSLHVNWSIRTGARGVQVYTPAAAPDAAPARRALVPIVGGGLRSIDAVPWERAQRPFLEASAAFGDALARQFADRGVPLFGQPPTPAPMRILMAVHMPAILVELGFLSNADDEQALASTEWQASVIEALTLALAELRQALPAGGDRR